MSALPGTAAATVARWVLFRRARRSIVPVALLAVGLTVLVTLGAATGAAGAQPTTDAPPVEDTGDGVDGADEGQDGDVLGGDAGEGDTASDDEDAEAEEKVRRNVILLVAVAAVALLLTALFWYHTIPSRRVIAARRTRAKVARGRGRRRPRPDPTEPP